ncbi:MAG TPA: hypothetical protein VEL31_08565 [Ktedonobacteraceae bacterium]|nr:hypothetical protein [Ktedonobacteraceae bacterium]
MWPFDQNNQQLYQQYAQARQTGDYSNIDQSQAMGNVQQFIQNAPADTQQQVYQQHFEQMPDNQRAQFAQQMPPEYGADPNNPQGMAQGFQRMGQEQPGMLSQLFGQGNASGNSMGQGGIGGLAGMVAQHMLGNQQRGNF